MNLYVVIWWYLLFCIYIGIYNVYLYVSKIYIVVVIEDFGVFVWFVVVGGNVLFLFRVFIYEDIGFGVEIVYIG